MSKTIVAAVPLMENHISHCRLGGGGGREDPYDVTNIRRRSVMLAHTGGEEKSRGRSPERKNFRI